MFYLFPRSLWLWILSSFFWSLVAGFCLIMFNMCTKLLIPLSPSIVLLFRFRAGLARSLSSFSYFLIISFVSAVSLSPSLSSCFSSSSFYYHDSSYYHSSYSYLYSFSSLSCSCVCTWLCLNLVRSLCLWASPLFPCLGSLACTSLYRSTSCYVAMPLGKRTNVRC